MNSYTKKIEKSDFNKIKSFFEDINAEFSTQEYATFRAKVGGAVAVLYNSGKLLIQGKEVDNLVQKLETFLGQPSQNPSTNQTSLLLKAQTQVQDIPFPHIGVDESGKGDYFGPLVIGGVLATEENAKLFSELGIKDSKKLTDEKIIKLAGYIKAHAVHSVVVIGNDKYNTLYDKFQNLNKLLAWGHARVIENILEKQECNYALSDKFGNENLIKSALIDKGKNIHLEQRVRGEDDIAVAAASILARAEYVNRMNTLSNRYEIELPKGASDKVLQTAKNFSSKWGKDKLSQVAKLHFKTTQLI